MHKVLTACLDHSTRSINLSSSPSSATLTRRTVTHSRSCHCSASKLLAAAEETGSIQGPAQPVLPALRQQLLPPSWRWKVTFYSALLHVTCSPSGPKRGHSSTVWRVLPRPCACAHSACPTWNSLSMTLCISQVSLGSEDVHQSFHPGGTQCFFGCDLITPRQPLTSWCLRDLRLHLPSVLLTTISTANTYGALLCAT